MWYWFFKRTIFYPLVRYGFRARIVGGEKVPDSGGAVLVSNHIATMDSIVIPAMIHRKVTFPAKAELFTGKGGPGSKVVAWFLKAVGMVPMDRGGGRASASSLGVIAQVMEDGHLIAMYPEGTRSPDGRLYKGKTGVARIALSNDVPVIPVGVAGTHKAKGPFGLPWVRRPVVVVGEPLHFSEFAGRQSETAVQRWVTDEVMAAIQSLTGQVYVDAYGSRVKHGDLKATGGDEFIRERPGGGPKPIPVPESRGD